MIQTRPGFVELEPGFLVHCFVIPYGWEISDCRGIALTPEQINIVNVISYLTCASSRVHM